MAWIAGAHLLAADYGGCIEWATKSLREPHTQIWGHLHLIAGLGHLNKQSDAATAISNLHRIRPDLTIPRVMETCIITDDTYLRNLIDGLREAGLPES